jgi:3-oxoacyl-[acyl-carrier-protein] synthase II
MLMYLPNMTACHIGIAQDAQGPNNTICAGEASGLLAMMEAARIIQRGEADVMIAGATSSRISITPMVYRGWENMSRRNDAPERAVRPFDADRDGTVSGEGAAALLLESETHARARGASVLARLAGWHSAFGSPQSPTATHQAWVRTIRSVLQSSQVDRHSLDHVNAHAAGTIQGDMQEAQAIQQAVGQVPVTAPKSYFGNLGPASSMLELAASVLSLAHEHVPGTLNYETPDPACPVQVIRDEPKRLERPGALVLSRSGTGQTSAVVLHSP